MYFKKLFPFLIPLFLIIFNPDFCEGNEHKVKLYDEYLPPNGGNCYGYAMGKAFGFSDNECDAMKASSVSTYYFYSNSYIISNVRSGDIISFYKHSVFVTSAPGNPSSADQIRVKHKLGEGKSIESNTLQEVINSYGTPKKIWRKKNWTVKVYNKINNVDYFGQVSLSDNIKNSPANYSVRPLSSHTITTKVNDYDEFGGYKQKFNKFVRNNSTNKPRTFSDEIIYEKDETHGFCEYVAHFRKMFRVTLKNNYTGVGCKGTIKVDGSVKNVPDEEFVEQTHDIIVSAQNSTYNNIIYTFDHWSNGSRSSQITISPDDNCTYTAYFKGKPVPLNVTQCGGAPGTYVKIKWQKHPNTNVTKYQIWRKVKHSQTGHTEGPTLLKTVSRNTTSYTDYDYVVTSGYTEDLLSYDIRPYYSTENVYADPEWHNLFGSGDIPNESETNEPDKMCIENNFSITCSPNPFNPVTGISVKISAESYVKLCIFNIKGRLVSTIVDRDLMQGYYKYFWNGTDNYGKELASGIYIARLVVREKSAQKTHILTQKLLKTK